VKETNRKPKEVKKRGLKRPLPWTQKEKKRKRGEGGLEVPLKFAGEKRYEISTNMDGENWGAHRKIENDCLKKTLPIGT